MKTNRVAMAEWNIQLISNPITHLFLQCCCFVAVAARPIQYQFLAAEEQIVCGKRHGITAAPAHRAAISPGNVWAAFVARGGVVNHSLIAEDERYVVRAVVELQRAAPGVDGRLGHPNSID